MSGQEKDNASAGTDAVRIPAQPEDSDIQLLRVMTEFEVREDVPAELEDVIWLSRLGLYKEARELFKENLEGREWFFPVLVEYADLLLSEGAYQELSDFLEKHSAQAGFSDAENQELQFMRALADVLCEDRPEDDEADFDDIETKLDIAVELCRNWHHEKVGKPLTDYDEYEIHQLELYLQIMVTAELDHHNIDEQFYHPPNTQPVPPDKWQGFESWCIALAQLQRFWESQRIFTILLPVLSFDRTRLLFEQFISQLEQFPNDEAVQLAELVATNAFLTLLVTRINRGKSQVSEVAEANSKLQHVKSLLLAIFGEVSAMRGPRFDEWRSTVEKLGTNATPDVLQWPSKTEAEKTSETSVCNQSRRKLESRGLSANGQRGPHDYYPEDIVNRFLNEDFIVEVLKCRCEKCSSHLQYLELTELMNPSLPRLINDKAKEIQKHNLGRSYRSLFCLLVLINAPMLILAFLDWKVDDNMMKQLCEVNPTPTVEEIEVYWALFQRKQPLESRQLAQKFRTHMYKFFLPKFEDGKIIRYPRLIVMPFENEQQLRASASTETYTFELHSYNAPAWNKGQASLVRRVLKRATPKDAERASTWKSLGHDNLLRPKVLYWHGSDLSVVSPKALGNLDDCVEAAFLRLKHTKLTRPHTEFRSKRTDLFISDTYPDGTGLSFSELRSGSLAGMKLWDQVKGLSEALEYLYSKKLGPILNIKPSNILLCKIGTSSTVSVLKLSDFAFSNREYEKESYAAIYKPPESSTGYDDEQAAKFAVYSLGCIFIELFIFAVYGPSGLQDFKQQLQSRLPAEEGEAEKMSRGSSYENRSLHFDTIEFMAFGEAQDEIHFEQEKCLNDLRCLFRRMVEPDVDQRCTINDVVKSFRSSKSVFERLNMVKYQEMDESLSAIDIEVAIDYKHPLEGFEPCQIRGFATKPLAIFTFATGYDRWSKQSLGPNVYFVPVYIGSKGDEKQGLEYWDFAIQNSSNSAMGPKQSLFRCYNQRDLFKAQQYLTGFECKISVRASVKEDAPAGLDGSHFAENSSASTVQLWAMSPRDLRDIHSETAEVPLHYRLVVYQEDKIIIISCPANTKPQLSDTKVVFALASESQPRLSSIIRPIFSRPSGNDSFSAFNLRPAVIPTNVNSLVRLEKLYSTKLRQFGVSFDSVNDAENFLVEFKKLMATRPQFSEPEETGQEGKHDLLEPSSRLTLNRRRGGLESK